MVAPEIAINKILSLSFMIFYFVLFTSFNLRFSISLEFDLYAGIPGFRSRNAVIIYSHNGIRTGTCGTYFRIYTGVFGMQADIASGDRDMSAFDMQGFQHTLRNRVSQVDVSETKPGSVFYPILIDAGHRTGVPGLRQVYGAAGSGLARGVHANKGPGRIGAGVSGAVIPVLGQCSFTGISQQVIEVIHDISAFSPFDSESEIKMLVG